MKKRIVQLVVMLVVICSVMCALLPSYRIETEAMSYSGSSSYKSGKYYARLTEVTKTGDQRTDIVNVARSQVGYQEGSSSSQLSGVAYGGKNYTEYGRWYGLQDMWCAMFVSWCADVAGVSTSVVPKHCFTPTGLQWFKDRGRAYSRASVANGKYTPQPGDIIYFKSSRNSNSTNHVGIVTKYSNGKVYTIEGNTSSATISTNGGAVCEKSYNISNTYIVYICSPAYKTSSAGTANTASSTSWLTGAVKDIVFDAEYYSNRYPDLRSAYGTDAAKLFTHFYTFGIKEGRCASPVFDIKYYVENNADLKNAYGTDYVAAMKHFVSFGINEARVTADPVNLGERFEARIGFDKAGLNFSLSDTNVITYTPSDKPAQIWTFERHPSGAYRIINSKNGYSLAVDGYNSECNVFISEYKDSRKQLWYIYEKGDGSYVFRSMAASGCVIDVYGGLVDSMTNVWSYNYNGSTAQRFSIKKLSGLNTMTMVDIGTDFYAKINASDGMNLSLNGDNVIIYGDSDADAQKWKFVRQSDGSYEIVNKKNDKLLDVYWAMSTSKSNVQIYQDHDNIAQRWFIYKVGEQYMFRPACSNTCVLDVEGNGTAALTNVQTYAYNGSDSQLFNLIMIEEKEEVAEKVPENLGDEFYAKITASSGKNLSLNDNNVIIYGESTAPAQVWRFARNEDGSYRIINQKTGYCLDVYGALDASGTNVQIYQGNDSKAQKWFIYKDGNSYNLRPACSETCLLDVEGNSSADVTNVRIYTANATDAQRFSINIIGNYFGAVSKADLGSGFYAKISSELGKNLSLCDDNVILYTPSDAAAQKWLFEKQADGSYKIVNSKNGKVLTVEGNIGNRGTNVVISEDINGLGQRWNIYLKEGKYVFFPISSSSNALNVEGGTGVDLANIQIHVFDNSMAQKYCINEVDAPSEINNDNMAVLRKIMYAVETGGQVYGQCDYSDFTEAYTNTSQEHAITIGAGQWYGPEAKTLLNKIRQTDPALFSSLDTAGIASDLDTKDWSTYKLSKSSAKAKCIQAIISTDVGKKCQDALMDEQLIKYIEEAKALGVTDIKAQMMSANIRHLGGLSALKRILNKTATPYTMDNIYAAMQTDTGNQVGTFKSRNKMVYNAINQYVK